MTPVELLMSQVETGTVWRMVVAERPGESLVLSLDRLGCISRPSFLCQLRHHGGLRTELGTALTFFMLEDREPTRAVNATTSLYRGLVSGFGKYGWEAGRKQAGVIQTALAKMGGDWTRVIGYCLSLEQESPGKQ